MGSRSFAEKCEQLVDLFSALKDPNDVYHTIIELGRALPPLAPELKCEKNLVEGCQSRMYLVSEIKNQEAIWFSADADALISRGLAALLLRVYSGERPEVVVKEKPLFLEQLKIPSALSPNRANGLYSLYLRLQQEAMKALIMQSSCTQE